MKKGILLVCMIFIGAFMAFIACSDNAADSNLTEGDPDDPNFVQAQGLAEAYVDTLFESFGMVFGYMTFEGEGPLKTTGDSLNINYDQETCWWQIYISSDSTDYSLVFIDSVRFNDETGCQMFPDSLTTTQIEYRAYLDLSVIADSGSIVMDAEENALVTGIQSDLVVLNASNSTYMDMDLGFLAITVDYDGSITNLTFDHADLEGEGPVYPLSGAASVAMTIAGSTQEGSGAGSWSVDITFYEDHYHARAESGDNYWEWDVYYEEPV
jgi:hypothetical protein